MLRIRRIKERRAQSILEYSMLMGVVVLIFVAMTTYLKRGAQGMVKLVADQVGVQEGSEQSNEAAYLISSYTKVDTGVEKTYKERIGLLGYTFDDRTDLFSNVYTNLGFSEVPQP